MATTTKLVIPDVWKKKIITTKLVTSTFQKENITTSTKLIIPTFEKKNLCYVIMNTRSRFNDKIKATTRNQYQEGQTQQGRNNEDTTTRMQQRRRMPKLTTMTRWWLPEDTQKLLDMTVWQGIIWNHFRPVTSQDDPSSWNLHHLGNAKFFSALNLASGFHQIPMHPNSKKYTAFSTSDGHFQYNRMPFGLKNAPATFQRMMDTALRGLIDQHCFVYLNDIIIFGSTKEVANRKRKSRPKRTHWRD